MPATRHACPSWGRVGVYEAQTSYPQVPQAGGEEFAWSDTVEIPVKTIFIYPTPFAALKRPLPVSFAR
jgi:hypothetical protein